MVYGMVYGMDYGMAWFACGGAHLDAAPCHGARNIQRLCPLTTFLASTDGGIACDRSYRDPAPCHSAQYKTFSFLPKTLLKEIAR